MFDLSQTDRGQNIEYRKQEVVKKPSGMKLFQFCIV